MGICGCTRYRIPMAVEVLTECSGKARRAFVPHLLLWDDGAILITFPVFKIRDALDRPHSMQHLEVRVEG